MVGVSFQMAFLWLTNGVTSYLLCGMLHQVTPPPPEIGEKELT